MKTLIDYIEDKRYNFFVTKGVARQIKRLYPQIDVYSPEDFFFIKNRKKWIVDSFYKDIFVSFTGTKKVKYQTVKMTKDFVGDAFDLHDTPKGSMKIKAGISAYESAMDICRAMSMAGVSVEELNKKPLLEIKLQDLDSVPIVYYKGKEIFCDSLVSILYNFETVSDSFGKQTIEIKGYDIDGFQSNKYLSLDTIKHERFEGD